MGVDLDKIISFRKDMHKYAELGFKEIETSRKIKEMLLSFGIQEGNIKGCVGTGIIVDIEGTGDASSDDKLQFVKSLALRADIDGLPMSENNYHLPYRSLTTAAHMCGHDGHTATLLATA